MALFLHACIQILACVLGMNIRAAAYCVGASPEWIGRHQAVCLTLDAARAKWFWTVSKSTAPQQKSSHFSQWWWWWRMRMETHVAPIFFKIKMNSDQFLSQLNVNHMWTLKRSCDPLLIRLAPETADEEVILFQTYFGLFQTAEQLVPEKAGQLWVKKNGSLAAPQSANSRKSASRLRKFFLSPV